MIQLRRDRLFMNSTIEFSVCTKHVATQRCNSVNTEMKIRLDEVFIVLHCHVLVQQQVMHLQLILLQDSLNNRWPHL